MGNYLWAKLEVRTADYMADKKLQMLMKEEGDPDSFSGVTEVTNEEARDGEMDDVETYCKINGIAFDRLTEAGLETSAEIEIFRPGTEPISGHVFVNNDWEPTITCREIFLILEDEPLEDKEKISRAIELAREYDFPCKMIWDYLSDKETVN